MSWLTSDLTSFTPTSLTTSHMMREQELTGQHAEEQEEHTAVLEAARAAAYAEFEKKWVRAGAFAPMCSCMQASRVPVPHAAMSHADMAHITHGVDGLAHSHVPHGEELGSMRGARLQAYHHCVTRCRRRWAEVHSEFARTERILHMRQMKELTALRVGLKLIAVPFIV